MHASALLFTLGLASCCAPATAPPPAPVPARHVCLLSAGYTWCATTRSCERQWETPCADNYRNCADCLKRQIDGENIACPPACDLISPGEEESCHCDPPPVCPPAPPGCTAAPPIVDSCGCVTECPAVTCGKGALCGGFAAAITTCTPPLECVTRAGPLIADAPGTCEAPCATQRDAMGNCMEPGCSIWYDGCNSCRVTHVNGVMACTERWCARPGAAACLDRDVRVGPGAICYRFCEDGSETPVQAACMDGLECIPPTGVHTDSCGESASRCAAPGH